MWSNTGNSLIGIVVNDLHFALCTETCCMSNHVHVDGPVLSGFPRDFEGVPPGYRRDFEEVPPASLGTLEIGRSVQVGRLIQVH